MRASARVRGALFLIGFTAVVAQVVLMRELIVVFYGNEMSLGVMLACWLLWTAVGSGILDRAIARIEPRVALAGLEIGAAAAFPLAIATVRESKGFFQTASGQLLGLGPMFATAFVALGVFCPLIGCLFPAGSRALARESGDSTGAASTYVYVLEGIGSAAGGLAATLLLAPRLSAFEIAALLAVFNLLVAIALLNRRVWVAIAAALVVLPFASQGAGAVEAITLARFWSGFRLLAAENSPYGNLAVLETEGSRSLAENGRIVATVPDPAAAEEAAHLPLLQHPRPERVLLVGGGAAGAIPEALKHPSVARLDYVEIDPAVPALARRYFAGTVPDDARLALRLDDGRKFLKRTGGRFDVVIVNAGEPQTAQLNRFYTQDFLREASSRLREGGIVAVAFPSSESYISPEAAALLRCIRKTFASVFRNVVALPGETVHVFGSNGPLAVDAETLAARMRERRIQAQYVNERFLPFRLALERVHELEQLTTPDARTPVNRDVAPIAYYFDMTAWSARFGSWQRRAFEVAGRVPFAALCAAAVGVAGLFAVAMRRSPAALCAGATGFTMIGVEVVLLIGFQAFYGYVYQEVAALVGAFMAGMAGGAWLAGRGRPLSLWIVQAIVAIAPIAVCLLQGYGSSVMALLAAATGVLGGYQFAVATRSYFSEGRRRAGGLYAADLAGSCIGAVVVSAYAVPVFGFSRTALLMGVVNAVPALAAFVRRTPAP